MNDTFSSRKTKWEPAPRPDWVTRINEEGSYMDIKSVVPLDENSLIATAKANTGLDDFGEDDWHEPFQILVKSFDSDSELNLMGRLMTRSDMLNALQSRLQVEDTFKRHPEINDEEITKPLYIIGQGRSGTSMLHNILAEDPDNGTTLQWENMFPCPPPEKETYHTDPRIERAEGLIQMVNHVVPEVASMHEFAARIPSEIINLHCLAFRSPWWLSFGGQSQAYAEYLQKQDMIPVYQYQKRLLKLLQWKNPRKHWIIKSPLCISYIPQILETYPDVGFVSPHRDPVKALSSVINLMGTLFWSRTDNPYNGNEFDALTNADLGAMIMSQPIELLESGVLPKEQLCNLHYADLIADPIAAVAGIYHYFGMQFTDRGRAILQQYMDDNPRSSRPAHKYNVGDPEQVKVERKAYQRYQEYFDVPSEI